MYKLYLVFTKHSREAEVILYRTPKKREFMISRFDGICRSSFHIRSLVPRTKYSVACGEEPYL